MNEQPLPGLRCHLVRVGGQMIAATECLHAVSDFRSTV